MIASQTTETMRVGAEETTPLATSGKTSCNSPKLAHTHGAAKSEGNVEGGEYVVNVYKKGGGTFIRFEKKSTKRSLRCILISTLLVVLLAAGAIWPLLQGDFVGIDDDSKHVKSKSDERAIKDDHAHYVHSRVPICDGWPCFEPSSVQVRRDLEGFPSYWNFAGPMNITYDARSLLINDKRILLLGGSMHPVRATQATWNQALDEAVQNGLNLITIYVFWSAHQEYEDSPFDWSLPTSDACTSPSCRWRLADAIRAAANRGLFVHIRIGPYDCAEYSYGGIPEWLPLKYPQMRMRRLEEHWLAAMKDFVRQTVDYLSLYSLWAQQGGPILMAQIENELGDDTGSFMGTGQSGSESSIQGYADWCGATAQKLSPKGVVWTMCNGLSAKNTILTFNGDWQASQWLESYGDSGRIQIDQPALWTEDEGGFQLWGEDPANPSDYFWGHTARDMAWQALRWFGRGGTHLNYYMWWGGYNRGRSAAAGIMNAYATDSMLCPDGHRHQPKYGHFQTLHRVLASIAPVLLYAPSAIWTSRMVQILDAKGAWVMGAKQEQLIYRLAGTDTREAIFVENNSETSIIARVFPQSLKDPLIFTMQGRSAVLITDGIVAFDSSSIEPRFMSFERKIIDDAVLLLDWAAWGEPVGTSPDSEFQNVEKAPVEQTLLNLNKRMWSDYAWYQTHFELDQDLNDLLLSVVTQKGNGIVVFVDGFFAGSVDNHEHDEGEITLAVALGSVTCGMHTLALLSESFGYHNLIGRWAENTGAKTKGIVGNVTLLSASFDADINLVDGRFWDSFAGLHGEQHTKGRGVRRKHLEGHLSNYLDPSSPSWSSAYFDTPRFDPLVQSLFLRIRTGRGHLWLNGRDLGRYWNITRDGAATNYSQEYYLLPHDYLYGDSGELNEIVLFDAFGNNHRDSQLVLAGTETSEQLNFADEVDFPGACMV